MLGLSVAPREMSQGFLCLVKAAIFYDFSKSGLFLEWPSEPETGASEVIPGHQQWCSNPISVNIIRSHWDETFAKAWSGKCFSPFSYFAHFQLISFPNIPRMNSRKDVNSKSIFSQPSLHGLASQSRKHEWIVFSEVVGTHSRVFCGLPMCTLQLLKVNPLLSSLFFPPGHLPYK